MAQRNCLKNGMSLKDFFASVRVGDMFCPFDGCGWTFFTSYALANHMKNSCKYGQYDGKVPCTHCQTEFEADELKAHWRLRHKIMVRDLFSLTHDCPIVCPNYTCCKTFYPNFSDCKNYVKHSITCRPLYICQVCKVEYLTELCLKRHKCEGSIKREERRSLSKTNVQVTRTIVDRPTLSDAEENKLVDNWKKLFREGNFLCPVPSCDKEFVVPNFYIKHLKLESDYDKIFEKLTYIDCLYCSSPVLLLQFHRHMNNNHRDISNVLNEIKSGFDTPCPNYTCKQIFNGENGKDYIKHALKCRPLFLCKECDSSFRNTKSLDIHMKHVHSNDNADTSNPKQNTSKSSPKPGSNKRKMPSSRITNKLKLKKELVEEKPGLNKLKQKKSFTKGKASKVVKAKEEFVQQSSLKRRIENARLLALANENGESLPVKTHANDSMFSPVTNTVLSSFAESKNLKLSRKKSIKSEQKIKKSKNFKYKSKKILKKSNMTKSPYHLQENQELAHNDTSVGDYDDGTQIANDPFEFMPTVIPSDMLETDLQGDHFETTTTFPPAPLSVPSSPSPSVPSSPSPLVPSSPHIVKTRGRGRKKSPVKRNVPLVENNRNKTTESNLNETQSTTSLEPLLPSISNEELSNSIDEVDNSQEPLISRHESIRNDTHPPLATEMIGSELATSDTIDEPCNNEEQFHLSSKVKHVLASRLNGQETKSLVDKWMSMVKKGIWCCIYPRCSERFTDIGKFQSHLLALPKQALQRHILQKLLPCCLCDKLTSLSSYVRHFKQNHGKEIAPLIDGSTFICPAEKCQLELDTAKEYIEHISLCPVKLKELIEAKDEERKKGLLSKWITSIREGKLLCANNSCTEDFILPTTFLSHLQECKKNDINEYALSLEEFPCAWCNELIALNDFPSHFHEQHFQIYEKLSEEGSQITCPNFNCFCNLSNGKELLEHTVVCPTCLYCFDCKQTFESFNEFTDHDCLANDDVFKKKNADIWCNQVFSGQLRCPNPSCNDSFFIVKDFIEHMNICSSKSKFMAYILKQDHFPCSFCRKFMTFNNIEIHIKEYHTEINKNLEDLKDAKPVTCLNYKCKKEFDNGLKYFHHAAICRPLYLCSTCSKEFSNIAEFKSHFCMQNPAPEKRKNEDRQTSQHNEQVERDEDMQQANTTTSVARINESSTTTAFDLTSWYDNVRQAIYECPNVSCKQSFPMYEALITHMKHCKKDNQCKIVIKANKFPCCVCKADIELALFVKHFDDEHEVLLDKLAAMSNRSSIRCSICTTKKVFVSRCQYFRHLIESHHSMFYPSFASGLIPKVVRRKNSKDSLKNKIADVQIWKEKIASGQLVCIQSSCQKQFTFIEKFIAHLKHCCCRDEPALNLLRYNAIPCLVCKRTYPANELSDHFRENHLVVFAQLRLVDQGIYIHCPNSKCKEAFSEGTEYLQHIATSCQPLYTCKTCEKEFETQELLSLHHCEEQSQPQQSDRLWDKLSQAPWYERIKKGDLVCPNSNCMKEFVLPRDFISHIRLCTEGREIQLILKRNELPCCFCKSYVSMGKYITHLSSCHINLFSKKKNTQKSKSKGKRSHTNSQVNTQSDMSDEQIVSNSNSGNLVEAVNSIQVNSVDNVSEDNTTIRNVLSEPLSQSPLNSPRSNQVIEKPKKKSQPRRLSKDRHTIETSANVIDDITVCNSGLANANHPSTSETIENVHSNDVIVEGNMDCEHGDDGSFLLANREESTAESIPKLSFNRFSKRKTRSKSESSITTDKSNKKDNLLNRSKDTDNLNSSSVESGTAKLSFNRFSKRNEIHPPTESLNRRSSRRVAAKNSTNIILKTVTGRKKPESSLNINKPKRPSKHLKTSIQNGGEYKRNEQIEAVSNNSVSLTEKEKELVSSSIVPEVENPSHQFPNKISLSENVDNISLKDNNESSIEAQMLKEGSNVLPEQVDTEIIRENEVTQNIPNPNLEQSLNESVNFDIDASSIENIEENTVHSKLDVSNTQPTNAATVVEKSIKSTKAKKMKRKHHSDDNEMLGLMQELLRKKKRRKSNKKSLPATNSWTVTEKPRNVKIEEGLKILKDMSLYPYSQAQIFVNAQGEGLVEKVGCDQFEHIGKNFINMKQEPVEFFTSTVQEATPVLLIEEATPVPLIEEATPVHTVEETSTIHTIEKTTGDCTGDLCPLSSSEIPRNVEVANSVRAGEGLPGNNSVESFQFDAEKTITVNKELPNKLKVTPIQQSLETRNVNVKDKPLLAESIFTTQSLEVHPMNTASTSEESNEENDLNNIGEADFNKSTKTFVDNSKFTQLNSEKLMSEVLVDRTKTNKVEVGINSDMNEEISSQQVDTETLENVQDETLVPEQESDSSAIATPKEAETHHTENPSDLVSNSKQQSNEQREKTLNSFKIPSNNSLAQNIHGLSQSQCSLIKSLDKEEKQSNSKITDGNIKELIKEPESINSQTRVNEKMITTEIDSLNSDKSDVTNRSDSSKPGPTQFSKQSKSYSPKKPLIKKRAQEKLPLTSASKTEEATSEVKTTAEPTSQAESSAELMFQVEKPAETTEGPEATTMSQIETTEASTSHVEKRQKTTSQEDEKPSHHAKTGTSNQISKKNQTEKQQSNKTPKLTINEKIKRSKREEFIDENLSEEEPDQSDKTGKYSLRGKLKKNSLVENLNTKIQKLKSLPKRQKDSHKEVNKQSDLEYSSGETLSMKSTSDNQNKNVVLDDKLAMNSSDGSSELSFNRFSKQRKLRSMKRLEKTKSLKQRSTIIPKDEAQKKFQLLTPSETTAQIEETGDTTLHVELPAATTSQIETTAGTTSQIEITTATTSQIEARAATTSQIETTAATTLQIETRAATTSQIETTAATTTQIETTAAITSPVETTASTTLQIGTPEDTISQVEIPSEILSKVETPAEVSPLVGANETTSDVEIPAATVSQTEAAETTSQVEEIAETTSQIETTAETTSQIETIGETTSQIETIAETTKESINNKLSETAAFTDSQNGILSIESKAKNSTQSSEDTSTKLSFNRFSKRRNIRSTKQTVKKFTRRVTTPVINSETKLTNNACEQIKSKCLEKTSVENLSTKPIVSPSKEFHSHDSDVVDQNMSSLITESKEADNNMKTTEKFEAPKDRKKSVSEFDSTEQHVNKISQSISQEETTLPDKQIMQPMEVEELSETSKHQKQDQPSLEERDVLLSESTLDEHETENSMMSHDQSLSFHRFKKSKRLPANLPKKVLSKRKPSLRSATQVENLIESQENRELVNFGDYRVKEDIPSESLASKSEMNEKPKVASNQKNLFSNEDPTLPENLTAISVKEETKSATEEEDGINSHLLNRKKKRKTIKQHGLRKKFNLRITSGRKSSQTETEDEEFLNDEKVSDSTTTQENKVTNITNDTDLRDNSDVQIKQEKEKTGEEGNIKKKRGRPRKIKAVESLKPQCNVFNPDSVDSVMENSSQKQDLENTHERSELSEIEKDICETASVVYDSTNEDFKHSKIQTAKSSDIFVTPSLNNRKESIANSSIVESCDLSFSENKMIGGDIPAYKKEVDVESLVLRTSDSHSDDAVLHGTLNKGSKKTLDSSPSKKVKKSHVSSVLSSEEIKKNAESKTSSEVLTVKTTTSVAAKIVNSVSDQTTQISETHSSEVDKNKSTSEGSDITIKKKRGRSKKVKINQHNKSLENTKEFSNLDHDNQSSLQNQDIENPHKMSEIFESEMDSVCETVTLVCETKGNTKSSKREKFKCSTVFIPPSMNSGKESLANFSSAESCDLSFSENEIVGDVPIQKKDLVMVDSASDPIVDGTSNKITEDILDSPPLKKVKENKLPLKMTESTKENNKNIGTEVSNKKVETEEISMEEEALKESMKMVFTQPAIDLDGIAQSLEMKPQATSLNKANDVPKSSINKQPHCQSSSNKVGIGRRFKYSGLSSRRFSNKSKSKQVDTLSGIKADSTTDSFHKDSDLLTLMKLKSSTSPIKSETSNKTEVIDLIEKNDLTLETIEVFPPIKSQECEEEDFVDFIIEPPLSIAAPIKVQLPKIDLSETSESNVKSESNENQDKCESVSQENQGTHNDEPEIISVILPTSAPKESSEVMEPTSNNKLTTASINNTLVETIKLSSESTVVEANTLNHVNTIIPKINHGSLVLGTANKNTVEAVDNKSCEKSTLAATNENVGNVENKTHKNDIESEDSPKDSLITSSLISSSPITSLHDDSTANLSFADDSIVISPNKISTNICPEPMEQLDISTKETSETKLDVSDDVSITETINACKPNINSADKVKKILLLVPDDSQAEEIETSLNQEGEIEASLNQEREIEASLNQEEEIEASLNQEREIETRLNEEGEIEASLNQEEEIETNAEVQEKVNEQNLPSQHSSSQLEGEEKEEIENALQDILQSLPKKPLFQKLPDEIWKSRMSGYDFICNYTGCGKSFIYPGHIYKHMAKCRYNDDEIKLNEIQYKCPECRKLVEFKKLAVHFLNNHPTLADLLKEFQENETAICRNFKCSEVLISVKECVRHFRKCGYSRQCRVCLCVYASGSSFRTHICNTGEEKTEKKRDKDSDDEADKPRKKLRIKLQRNASKGRRNKNSQRDSHLKSNKEMKEEYDNSQDSDTDHDDGPYTIDNSSEDDIISTGSVYGDVQLENNSILNKSSTCTSPTEKSPDVVQLPKEQIDHHKISNEIESVTACSPITSEKNSGNSHAGETGHYNNENKLQQVIEEDSHCADPEEFAPHTESSENQSLPISSTRSISNTPNSDVNIEPESVKKSESSNKFIRKRFLKAKTGIIKTREKSLRKNLKSTGSKFKVNKAERKGLNERNENIFSNDRMQVNDNYENEVTQISKENQKNFEDVIEFTNTSKQDDGDCDHGSMQDSDGYFANNSKQDNGECFNNSKQDDDSFVNNSKQDNDSFANNSKQDNGYFANNSKQDNGYFANNSKQDNGYFANNSEQDNGEFADNSKQDIGVFANDFKQDNGEFADNSKQEIVGCVNDSQQDNGNFANNSEQDNNEFANSSKQDIGDCAIDSKQDNCELANNVTAFFEDSQSVSSDNHTTNQKDLHVDTSNTYASSQKVDMCSNTLNVNTDSTSGNFSKGENLNDEISENIQNQSVKKTKAKAIQKRFLKANTRTLRSRHKVINENIEPKKSIENLSKVETTSTINVPKKNNKKNHSLKFQKDTKASSVGNINTTEEALLISTEKEPTFEPCKERNSSIEKQSNDESNEGSEIKEMPADSTIVKSNNEISTNNQNDESLNEITSNKGCNESSNKISIDQQRDENIQEISTGKRGDESIEEMSSNKPGNESNKISASEQGKEKTSERMTKAIRRRFLKTKSKMRNPIDSKYPNSKRLQCDESHNHEQLLTKYTSLETTDSSLSIESSSCNSEIEKNNLQSINIESKKQLRKSSEKTQCQVKKSVDCNYVTNKIKEKKKNKLLQNEKDIQNSLDDSKQHHSPNEKHVPDKENKSKFTFSEHKNTNIDTFGHTEQISSNNRIISKENFNQSENELSSKNLFDKLKLDEDIPITLEAEQNHSLELDQNFVFCENNINVSELPTPDEQELDDKVRCVLKSETSTDLESLYRYPNVVLHNNKKHNVDTWVNSIASYNFYCPNQGCYQSHKRINTMFKHMKICFKKKPKRLQVYMNRELKCPTCHEKFPAKKLYSHFNKYHLLLNWYFGEVEKGNWAICQNHKCAKYMEEIDEIVEHALKCKYLWKCKYCEIEYNNEPDVKKHHCQTSSDESNVSKDELSVDESMKTNQPTRLDNDTSKNLKNTKENVQPVKLKKKPEGAGKKSIQSSKKSHDIDDQPSKSKKENSKSNYTSIKNEKRETVEDERHEVEDERHESESTIEKTEENVSSEIVTRKSKRKSASMAIEKLVCVKLDLNESDDDAPIQKRKLAKKGDSDDEFELSPSQESSSSEDEVSEENSSNESSIRSDSDDGFIKEEYSSRKNMSIPLRGINYDEDFFKEWYENVILNDDSYPNMMPDEETISHLSINDYEEHLPHSRHSPTFSISYHTSSGKTRKTPEKQLECFEVLEEFKESSSAAFNVGGPVWGMDWCPVPEWQEQYLAVTTLSRYSEAHSTTITREMPGLIQIWLMKNVEKKLLPSFAFGICHNYGPIYEISWCPTGCFNVENDEIIRIGLLATACGDSKVRIFSIPDPKKFLGKDKAFVKMKPSLILLPGKIDAIETISWGCCLCISWQLQSERRKIAAGYGDGSVRIWYPDSNSIFLKTEFDGCEALLPTIQISAHSYSIRSIAWCPYNENIFCTASSDKSIKVFNMYEPNLPIFAIKRAFCLDVEWPMARLGFFFTEDDCFNVIPVSARYLNLEKYFLPYKDEKDGPAATTRHNSAVWSCSYNNFMDMVASCDDAGEVIVAKYIDLLCKKPDRNRTKLEPVYHIKREWKSDKETEAQKSKIIEENFKCGETDNVNVLGNYEWSVEEEEKIYHQYKYVFMDANQFEFTTNRSKKDAASIRNMKISLLQKPELDSIETRSVQKITWNPNIAFHSWLATGTKIGIIRLHNFDAWT